MVGVLVWAASTAWTGWQSPGSRPMWVSVLLLAVFTGLALHSLPLAPASPSCGPAEPVHHAASRRAARHAHA
nr:hypothetical protein [Streptomyces sp. 2231.1]